MQTTIPTLHRVIIWECYLRSIVIFAETCYYLRMAMSARGCLLVKILLQVLSNDETLSWRPMIPTALISNCRTAAKSSAGIKESQKNIPGIFTINCEFTRCNPWNLRKIMILS